MMLTHSQWGFSGVNSFAHLEHIKCLTKPDTPFDIAILGVPFDTAVSYRPGMHNFSFSNSLLLLQHVISSQSQLTSTSNHLLNTKMTNFLQEHVSALAPSALRRPAKHPFVGSMPGHL